MIALCQARNKDMVCLPASPQEKDAGEDEVEQAQTRPQPAVVFGQSGYGDLHTAIKQ
jgi:hypothetical protein